VGFEEQAHVAPGGTSHAAPDIFMKTTLLSLAFFGLACATNAVSPTLNSTSPLGGQRGTEMEITFRGERLDDAKEILLYSPGIQVLKLEPGTNTPLRAQVKIAADCRLGEHALRVRTATGLSDLRTFWVGPFPTIEEKEPNDELAKAQKIPMIQKRTTTWASLQPSISK